MFSDPVVQSTSLKLALSVPLGSHAHPGTNRCGQGCVGLLTVRPGLPAHLQTLRSPHLTARRREEESEEDAVAGRQGNGPEWVEQSRNAPSLHARSWARCAQYTMSLNPHDNTCHYCRFTGKARGSERPAPPFQVRKLLSSPRSTWGSEDLSPDLCGWACAAHPVHGNTHAHW